MCVIIWYSVADLLYLCHIFTYFWFLRQLGAAYEPTLSCVLSCVFSSYITRILCKKFNLQIQTSFKKCDFVVKLPKRKCDFVVNHQNKKCDFVILLGNVMFKRKIYDNLFQWYGGLRHEIYIVECKRTACMSPEGLPWF